MHDTAFKYGKNFFDTYLKEANGLTVVDIGSQDVNGSLKSAMPGDNKYIGVDFAEGKGVDIVITDPYSLPFENNTVDACVCSSCFEHSEFFWLLYNEVLRILKPEGIFYLNVPSNGIFHRFPVDCWRFFPDSGIALQNWGRKSGYNTVLLESFTGKKMSNNWNDFVAVFLKDENYVQKYPQRIQENITDYTNGLVYGHSDFSNFSYRQDERKSYTLKRVKKNIVKISKQIEANCHDVLVRIGGVTGSGKDKGSE